MKFKYIHFFYFFKKGHINKNRVFNNNDLIKNRIYGPQNSCMMNVYKGPNRFDQNLKYNVS